MSRNRTGRAKSFSLRAPITMPLSLHEGFGSKWIERDDFKKVINSIEAIMKKFKIDLYWELVFDNNQPAIVIYPLSEKEEQKLKL